MALYNDQIQRIKDKLPQAKMADKNLKVSGAGRHKYQLNAPASNEEVTKFEEKYGVLLPDCYKTFILQVGNGGVSFDDSAAGPYYGIYPLGKNADELVYPNAEKYLKNDCLIYPRMSDHYWKSLIENIENEDISDTELDEELGKIWGGILPIGSQGCSYLHGIILQGVYKGRVVNLSIDRQKPQFAFENNFLDWYERWLDEIVSGELLKEGPAWFGYAIGGSDLDLIHEFIQANTIPQKEEFLDGIYSKGKIEAATIQIIEEQFLKSTDELKTRLLQILAKFDFEKATPYLTELIKTDLRTVCQCIHWYAKHKSAKWLPLIVKQMNGIDDDETFRFCTYVLIASKADIGHLIIPFAKKENESIQVTAFYTLGQLKNKSDFLDVFINGLNDRSHRVIHATLQALDGVTSKKLLAHYRRIAERFPDDQHYILTNLNRRLAAYGLTDKILLNR